MAEELTALYNTQTAHIPLCQPVRAEDLNEALIPELSAEAKSVGGEQIEKLQGKTTYVAVDGERLRGFVLVGTAPEAKAPDPETPDADVYDLENYISFLLYERGHRKAGQMLLDAAHNYFPDSDNEPIVAFNQEFRLPWYHVIHGFCTDRLDHVQALFEKNGYGRRGGEVFLLWEDMVPPVPRAIDLPVQVKVDWRNGLRKMPGLDVCAMLEGKEIGRCTHCSLGNYSRNPDMQNTAFCTWLGVDDEYQGGGLGVHLLHRSLHELKNRGYDHAAISTALHNHRAYLFYSNHGYRTVDWSYGFVRPGTETGAAKQPE